MILLLDNYDSFSYNLYQLIGSLDPDIRVIRNDDMTVDEIRALHPQAIVISPGPGKPEDAGICIEAVQKLGGAIPILGVCLGHQAICAAFGATVSYARTLMHGKQSMATVDTVARCIGIARKPCRWQGIIPWQRWRARCRIAWRSQGGRTTARSCR